MLNKVVDSESGKKFLAEHFEVEHLIGVFDADRRSRKRAGVSHRVAAETELHVKTPDTSSPASQVLKCSPSASKEQPQGRTVSAGRPAAG